MTFAHLMLGAPDHVRAWGSLFPEGTDESTGILLGYDGGAVATLYCGLRGATPGNAVVVGTGGRIEITGRFHCPSAFTLIRGGEAETYEVPFTGNGMAMAFQSAEIALPALVAYARGEISWPETRARVARGLRRRFGLRLASAKALHPFLLQPRAQRWFRFLSRARLVPFASLHAALH